MRASMRHCEKSTQNTQKTGRSMDDAGLDGTHVKVTKTAAKCPATAVTVTHRSTRTEEGLPEVTGRRKLRGGRQTDGTAD